LTLGSDDTSASCLWVDNGHIRPRAEQHAEATEQNLRGGQQHDGGHAGLVLIRLESSHEHTIAQCWTGQSVLTERSEIRDCRAQESALSFGPGTIGRLMCIKIPFYGACKKPWRNLLARARDRYGPTPR
jgi:hypothetical protein